VSVAGFLPGLGRGGTTHSLVVMDIFEPACVATGDAGPDNPVAGVSGLMTEAAIDSLSVAAFVTIGAGRRGGGLSSRIGEFVILTEEFRTPSVETLEFGGEAFGGDVVVGEVCVIREGIERFARGFCRDAEVTDIPAIFSVSLAAN